MSEERFEQDENLDNAVAIIAMGGRFPQAANLEKFWSNLYNGVESVKHFSKDDLQNMGIDKHLLDNPRFVAADAVLEDIDKFDAAFFDYSAREAEITDPQHRLFLETAWEVMERAGYNSDEYKGRTAVFAGSNLSGYMIRNLYSNPGLVDQLGSFKVMISNGQDFLATKVSHKMNLTGPSVNVNTLCSSSMVAVHFACRSLLSYDCDLALAGAVSIQITRNEAFFYTEGGIGSSDGHCRAFDSHANGTVSGSGLAVIALKRLEDAIADGDHIEAVIRGTAINNDGALKNSYTAPSVDGQAECIAEALAISGVDPETISYIDAHGTGTNLGDPIEIAALSKVYESQTDKKQFCAIGSVKTNIGHLVHAGGIASLIKTVLSMQHKTIPATLNFEEPNSKIDFVNSPFYINSKRCEWRNNGKPLRAGVSSFGIGGTNTHVILEEAPKTESSEPSKRERQIIVLSAKTASALETMTTNLGKFIEKNSELNLADIAFTLAVGRRNFSHKRAIVCKSISDLSCSLKNPDGKKCITSYQKDRTTLLVLVFPDNLATGIDYRDFYENEEQFKTAFDDCAKLISKKLNVDITRLLDSENTTSEIMLQRCFTFSIEYSFAKLLEAWGIITEKAICLGVGSVAAACLAGSVNLEDAVGIISSGKSDSLSFDKPKFKLTGFDGNEFVPDKNYFNSQLSEEISDRSNLSVQLESPDELVFVIGSKKEVRADNENNLCFLLPENNEKVYSSVALAAAKYWSLGGKISWTGFYANEKRRRVALPTYPFERQRYWIEPGNRNENGEIKKPKLTLRKRPELDTAYRAPETEVQKKICRMAAETLGYEKIGVDDDFFELGGHSLLAVALIAKLRNEFKKDITLESLFENTTVAMISKFFDDDSFDEGTI